MGRVRVRVRETKIRELGSNTVVWRVRTQSGLGVWSVSSVLAYYIPFSQAPAGAKKWNMRVVACNNEEDARRAHNEICAIIKETLMPGDMESE